MAPDWGWAEARLRDAHNYWLATTRPDGRPHLVPTWGAWIDDALWFCTYRGTVKTVNLATEPRATIATETPGEVVLVEGSALPVDERELPTAFAVAMAAKYGDGETGIGDERTCYYRLAPVRARWFRESEALSEPGRRTFSGRA